MLFVVFLVAVICTNTIPFLSQLNCFEKGALEAAKLLKVKKKSTTYNLSFLPLITPFTSLFEKFWELPTRNSCAFNRTPNCDERRGVCNFRCFPPLFHVARNPRGDLVKERVTDLKQRVVNLLQSPIQLTPLWLNLSASSACGTRDGRSPFGTHAVK